MTRIDDTSATDNRTLTEGIPILATKCVECHEVQLLSMHETLIDDEATKAHARLVAGMGARPGRTWCCSRCATKADREHARRNDAVRLDASLRAQVWRGQR